MNRSNPPAGADDTQRGGALDGALWALAAAFGAYFCMYAFRRPFTAASFAGAYAGIGYKSLLVTAQVIGYAASKFIGIRVVAETPWNRRVGRFLTLIAAAEAALVLFAILPPPWNALGLLLNGLSLGMVFGMVLGFLEGRRVTEALSAGLCASFILADGVTKSVGFWLLEQGVSETWMPSVAGLLFVAPLCGFAAMLSRIAPPSRADQHARSQRTTMDAAERSAFLRRYAVGLGALVTMYLLITILRSFRADFQPELFRELGQTVTANLFARTELVVMLGVLVVNGLAATIRDNHTAFHVSLATCGMGLLCVLLALVGWRLEWFGGVAFMILVGLGVYFPYVAVHTTVFERLLAMTRDRGNLGFLMYVADAVGYLGYAGVMLLRSAAPQDSALTIFGWLCAGCVALSAAALCVAWRFFSVRPAVVPSLLVEETV
jgi:hypothetical protein